MLIERQTLGMIKDLRCQVPIVLQEGKRVQRIVWRCDFSFTVVATSQTELLEAKGVETDVYKLKLKLYRAKAPYALEIWKGNWRSPMMAERIEAKEKEIV